MRLILLTLLFLCLVTTALASDGVLEINQTCAVETGCFSGDAPGFPVTLTALGSYRLTGNLSLPDIDTTAILVDAEAATIDMAGFGIIFPGNGCSTEGCPQGSGDGIARNGSGRRITVLNGFVENAGRYGLLLSSYARVENVRVLGSGQDGIALSTGIVKNCQVEQSGGFGVSSGSDTVLAYNILDGNNLLDAGAQDLGGGQPTIGNICGDLSCGPAPQRRRFYLTLDVFNGSASNACRPGFHVASVYEVYDPTGLEYESGLGFPGDGEGPPDESRGWAYDGSGNNCSNYTSSSGIGRRLYLSATSSTIGPWGSQELGCSLTSRVWCVED
jgi:hypothetical protein